MKLAWLLWMASVLPPQAADSLCLTTTVYLEARDQSTLGQKAVAEVALRRAESKLWGDSVCDAVTARKQFAPSIVSPNTRLNSAKAWRRAVQVSLDAQRNWQLPIGQRQEIVPGASHFMAHALVSPEWGNAPEVAVIGGHTFLKVQRLRPAQG